MIKGIAKLVAYKKAPMRTFVLLHPIRALKWGAMFFLGKKIWEGVRSEGTPKGQTTPRRASTRQTTTRQP